MGGWRRAHHNAHAPHPDYDYGYVSSQSSRLQVQKADVKLGLRVLAEAKPDKVEAVQEFLKVSTQLTLASCAATVYAHA